MVPGMCFDRLGLHQFPVRVPDLNEIDEWLEGRITSTLCDMHCVGLLRGKLAVTGTASWH